MGEGASTNNCSWEKDFTSFHHVKCTELGEHTLNKFYQNLLSFIFRTVEILSLGFFPRYHKEESGNSCKLGCGYYQKKKFGRPASLEVEHSMVYLYSSLMAFCQIQLTTLLFKICSPLLLTSTNRVIMLMDKKEAKIMISSRNSFRISLNVSTH